MSAATDEIDGSPELAEKRTRAEELARAVGAILREYAPKLAALNGEFFQVLDGDIRSQTSRAAWLLDQSEIMRKPLLAILSRGSGLREISPLEPMTRDELSLRMFEIEIQLHHMIRHTNQLRDKLASYKLSDHVAKLRMAAGLPGGQNGPRVGP